MLPNIHLFIASGRNRSWLRDMHYFALSVVAGFLLFAIDASLASEKAALPYRLRVRPSICVSYDSAQPCTMAMEVTWEGEVQADVCLRDPMTTPMLFCWKNAREGRVALDYANTTDMVYQLVEERSQGVLAETEVKVINRDLRSSRKRRRHVWSIL
jgi:hypothetical protein